MTFKQIDINLDRFKYIVEGAGIIVIRKRLFSVSRRFVPFENVGSRIIRNRERKLLWLIISVLFFIVALLVFIERLKGDKNISDTAEGFWVAVSVVFYIIYAFKRKNILLLVKDDEEDAIEFIGTKIYSERLSQFLAKLQQQRDQYLSDKYPTIEGLTVDESIYCCNAEIQPSDGLLLKKLTKRPLEQLIFENEYSKIRKPMGVRSVTTEKKAREILRELQCKLLSEDKYIFICAFSGNEYHVGLLGNTSDPYRIMEYAETNGVNYDIKTKDIIEKCRQWDSEFGIKLTSIGFDFCECEVENKNIDYKKLAAEVYKFCPDVVDQGTGTIERLESEMKKDGRIFLWWD